MTRIICDVAEETFVSQSELARRSGVSQPHISAVFNGKTYFNLDQLEAICVALGVQILAVIQEALQVIGHL